MKLRRLVAAAMGADEAVKAGVLGARVATATGLGIGGAALLLFVIECQRRVAVADDGARFHVRPRGFA